MEPGAKCRDEGALVKPYIQREVSGMTRHVGLAHKLGLLQLGQVVAKSSNAQSRAPVKLAQMEPGMGTDLVEEASPRGEL